MTTQEKKDKIRELVSEMINQSCEDMAKNIDRVLDSGAINIDEWDESNAPMILPKCIVTALLEKESLQYNGSGTSHERRVKKQVKLIRYHV